MILTGLGLSVAVVGPPGIVTALGDATVFPCEDEAVGAVVQLRLPVDTFPKTVTVRGVANHTGFHLARVLLLSSLLRVATSYKIHRPYVKLCAYIYINTAG